MISKIKSAWKAYKAVKKFVRQLDAKGVKLFSDAGALATRNWLLNDVLTHAKDLTQRWPFNEMKWDDQLLRWVQIVFKSERLENKLNEKPD